MSRNRLPVSFAEYASPDLAALADVYGAAGYRITKAEQIGTLSAAIDVDLTRHRRTSEVNQGNLSRSYSGVATECELGRTPTGAIRGKPQTQQSPGVPGRLASCTDRDALVRRYWVVCASVPGALPIESRSLCP